MRNSHGHPAPAALVGAFVPFAAACAFLFLYRDVVSGLIHDWITDGNYSHGLLVAPVALFIAWQRRCAFTNAPRRPQLWGLALTAASVALLVFGTLGAEFFTAR